MCEDSPYKLAGACSRRNVEFQFQQGCQMNTYSKTTKGYSRLLITEAALFSAWEELKRTEVSDPVPLYRTEAFSRPQQSVHSS